MSSRVRLFLGELHTGERAFLTLGLPAFHLRMTRRQRHEPPDKPRGQRGREGRGRAHGARHLPTSWGRSRRRTGGTSCTSHRRRRCSSGTGHTHCNESCIMTHTSVLCYIFMYISRLFPRSLSLHGFQIAIIAHHEALKELLGIAPQPERSRDLEKGERPIDAGGRDVPAVLGLVGVGEAGVQRSRLELTGGHLGFVLEGGFLESDSAAHSARTNRTSSCFCNEHPIFTNGEHVSTFQPMK